MGYAGYSLRIYHLDLAEVNRVRQTLGLAPLAPSTPSAEQIVADLAAMAISPRPIRVAVFVPALEEGPGLDVLRHALSGEHNVALVPLGPAEIQAGKLNEFDVLLVPGGKASQQGTLLSSAGRKAVREFVRRGGGYVGICGGAFLATTNYEWSLKLINARSLSGTRYVPGHGPQLVSDRGHGTVWIELTSAGRAVFGGSAGLVAMNYSGGPILLPGNEPHLPDYVTLARYRSEVFRFPFQKGSMLGAPAIVASRFGEGRVVLFGVHPEAPPREPAWLGRALRACAKPPVGAP